MRKILFLIMAITIFASAAHGMGSRPQQRGVIIFFNSSGIVLKANKTRLGDIAETLENLAGVKVTVDDSIRNNKITADLKEKNIEELLKKIVGKVPLARYIKIAGSDKEKKLENFIIFKKSREASEINIGMNNLNDGLKVAFLSKHNALPVSGKLSTSGTFKVSKSSRYIFPDDIKPFAADFINSNRTLLNLQDVSLRIKKLGREFVNYEQYFNGVVVDNLRSYAFQARCIKDDDGSFSILISNNSIPNISISVQPKISEESAVELVLTEIRKLGDNRELYTGHKVIPEAVELRILPQLDIEADRIIEKFKTMALYWSVNIDFFNYYVDAKTGKVYKSNAL